MRQRQREEEDFLIKAKAANAGTRGNFSATARASKEGDFALVLHAPSHPSLCKLSRAAL